MMGTTIIKNQEFIILSKEVTNATKCIVTEISDEECFNVELISEERYFPEESLEFFSVSGSGILYFSTQLKEIDGKFLTVKYPDKSSVIQRRKYTRAEIHKNILIYTKEHTIRATIIDISAGGMCLIADTEMSKEKDYQTEINLEKNLTVNCKFKPVRVNIIEEKKYKISGQFLLMKNVDKIALTQYCLKKVTEIQNK